MTEQEFRAELRYRMALSAARTLLDSGIISTQEYCRIDEILLKKHQPLLGTLLAGKPLP